MSIMRSFPNQFAVGVLVTTSTGGTQGVGSTSILFSQQAADFGFPAGLIKMVVDVGGPAYVQFNGQVATTNDYRLSSGDTLTDWYDIGTGANGVSITATSTGLQMRVGAWG